MRVSQFFISTLKEAPSEAELVSHKLMVRAGYIKKLASGLYTWMPLGLRVLRKVEKIVRQEMDLSGGIELLMPAVQPAELWQETGRWDVFGPQMLKISDRHDNQFCFGPTHEEVITDIARREIRSYRQLPVNFYQIQTKFRDEVRPRFGVMRAREFLMKDAYSFHADYASLELGLYLVEVDRQLPVTADLAACNVGDHFLMGRAETELVVVPVADLEHLRPEHVPTSCLLPQFGGLDGRHQQFYPAAEVHFLTHDFFNLAQHAQTKRHPSIKTAGQLLDITGTHHQFVADKLGFRGCFFFRSGDEKLGYAHREYNRIIKFGR